MGNLIESTIIEVKELYREKFQIKIVSPIISESMASRPTANTGVQINQSCNLGFWYATVVCQPTVKPGCPRSLRCICCNVQLKEKPARVAKAGSTSNSAICARTKLLL